MWADFDAAGALNECLVALMPVNNRTNKFHLMNIRSLEEARSLFLSLLHPYPSSEVAGRMAFSVMKVPEGVWTP